MSKIFTRSKRENFEGKDKPSIREGRASQKKTVPYFKREKEGGETPLTGRKGISKEKLQLSKSHLWGEKESLSGVLVC